jgi:hypothetical protein
MNAAAITPVTLDCSPNIVMPTKKTPIAPMLKSGMRDLAHPPRPNHNLYESSFAIDPE